MKKLAVLIVCTAVMASCDSFSGGSKDQLKAENDSLLMELTQRNAELDEMMVLSMIFQRDSARLMRRRAVWICNVALWQKAL